MEAHPAVARTRLPLRPREAAQVMRLRRALRCEGPEIVLAEDECRGGAERGAVERTPEGPLESPAKGRRRRVVESDIVAIPPRAGALPGVEARPHRVHRLDPAVVRQEGVERAPE